MARVSTWLGSEDSKLWFVLARLSAFFGIVTPVFTVIVLVLTTKSAVPTIVLAVYVCVLATVLITILIRQENRFFSEIKRQQSEKELYRREMQYGPATMPMRKAFTCVANASWNLLQGDPSQEAFRLRLQESLRYFAEAFSLITGTTCRASIKLLQAPPANSRDRLDIRVSTLCRDSNESGRSPREYDRIGDNTDFRQIFTVPKPYFFSNDLTALLSKGLYHNSHWGEEVIANGAFDYRATIVWPIERIDAEGPESPEYREVIGFLCVDSLTTDAFHSTYDVALGGAFCQALHLALHRFRSTYIR